MAAPTDVAVEALSITSTIIRWAYAGTNQIAVYRSTDGVSYAEATTAGSRVPVGTLSYTDTGLDTATKYWYKLTDDLGSTFSSVVTVYTHTCGVPPSTDSDVILPRAGAEVTPRDFDDLAVRVETGLVRFTNPDGRTCVACITDGALVIDCVDFNNCEVIEVEVTEDVNSISMPNCENGITQIDFLIPPGTSRLICGWPPGMGFSGDECRKAPISGGTEGRRMSVPTRQQRSSPTSRSRPGYARGGGGGGMGASCTCVPTANGGLTIKSCTPNNSLGCSGTKSLNLKACGGLGPYTWSNTGSVVLSASSGSTTTVTPPTNSGSAVAGSAYWIDCHYCITCLAGVCTSAGSGGCFGSYSCSDAWIEQGTCTRVVNCSGGGAGSPDTGITDGQLSTCCNANANVCSPTTPCVDCRNCPSGVSVMCDQRTAPMIAAGCNPCGLQQGATVSVTDSLGTVATIILRA